MNLTLHLTTDCNLACDYCYAPPRPGREMSEATARQALAFGAAQSKGSCGIVFFGGEPLRKKRLIRDLVGWAHDRERVPPGTYHFKITTNGLLLDEDFLSFTLKHDVLVSMSFDGVREANDRHRRFPDGSPSYDLLVERLRLLLAYRPYASVIMVVNPDTARHLAESVEFLAGLGCRYLIVSLNYAADWRRADLKTLARQYERLGELYIEWTRADRKFYLSPFEVKLSSHINRDCFEREQCALGRRQLSVDPDGNIFPCVQFPRAGADSPWRIGRVDTGIDEAARGRIYFASQREKESCRGCAIRSRCLNNCGCLNWQATGSLTKVPPVLCRNEQLLIGVADRVGRVLYQEKNPLFLHKHYNAAYPLLSLMEDAALAR